VIAVTPHGTVHAPEEAPPQGEPKKVTSCALEKRYVSMIAHAVTVIFFIAMLDSHEVNYKCEELIGYKLIFCAKAENKNGSFPE
jgi:hypothetical protein